MVRIVNWLKGWIFNVYIKAPVLIGNIGGWENREPLEICSAMTTVTASFWDANKQECTDLIVRRFDSYYTLWIATLVVLLVCLCLVFICVRVCCVQPCINAVDRLQHTLAGRSPLLHNA